MKNHFTESYEKWIHVKQAMGVEETGNRFFSNSRNSVKGPLKKENAGYFGSSVKHSNICQREYVQSGNCSYLQIYIQQTKPLGRHDSTVGYA